MRPLAKPLQISLFEPFTVEPTVDREASSPTINFAADRARMYEERAMVHAAEGNTEAADELQKQAQDWRDLMTLTDEEGFLAEMQFSHQANEAIDGLLELAKKGEQAISDLSLLSDKLFGGLNDLSANGSRVAAEALQTILHAAVVNFTDLIIRRPEPFRAVMRASVGIPGIITRNAEATENNATLVKRLEVAADHPIDIHRSGKVPKLTTPVNYLAHRLLNHINHTMMLMDSSQFLDAPPYWANEAMALPRLSPSTWQPWFDLSWKILLDATNNEPERNPLLFPIGESARNKKPKFSKKVGERAKMGRVRDKIKERVCGAIKLLAGSKP